MPACSKIHQMGTNPRGQNPQNTCENARTPERRKQNPQHPPPKKQKQETKTPELQNAKRRRKRPPKQKPRSRYKNNKTKKNAPTPERQYARTPPKRQQKQASKEERQNSEKRQNANRQYTGSNHETERQNASKTPKAHKTAVKTVKGSATTEQDILQCSVGREEWAWKGKDTCVMGWKSWMQRKEGRKGTSLSRRRVCRVGKGGGRLSQFYPCLFFWLGRGRGRGVIFFARVFKTPRRESGGRGVFTCTKRGM